MKWSKKQISAPLTKIVDPTHQKTAILMFRGNYILNRFTWIYV